MFDAVVTYKTTTVVVDPDINSVTVKQNIPNVTVYDGRYIDTVVFVDAGYYNQEGVLISAGLYNTTSWDETWSSLV